MSQAEYDNAFPDERRDAPPHRLPAAIVLGLIATGIVVAFFMALAAGCGPAHNRHAGELNDPTERWEKLEPAADNSWHFLPPGSH